MSSYFAANTDVYHLIKGKSNYIRQMLLSLLYQYRRENYGNLSLLIYKYELFFLTLSSSLSGIYFFSYWNVLFCLYCLVLLVYECLRTWNSSLSLPYTYFLPQSQKLRTAYMTRGLRERSACMVAYINSTIGLREESLCFPRICFLRLPFSVWCKIQ